MVFGAVWHLVLYGSIGRDVPDVRLDVSISDPVAGEARGQPQRSLVVARERDRPGLVGLRLRARRAVQNP